MRANDSSNTPLEFIYEAADCRMFYTAPMVNDVTMVWKGVADRMFGGDNKKAQCVQNSTGDKSTVSAGGQAKGGSVPSPASNPPSVSNMATSIVSGMGQCGWVALAAVMTGLLVL